MNLSRIATPLLALTASISLLTACNPSSLGVGTGRWQSQTTSSGYLWLRLNDDGSRVSGTVGTSTSSGSTAISGSSAGEQLSIGYSSANGSISFRGPVDGDTFTAATTVCTSSCTSGTIVFTRTSYAATELVNARSATGDGSIVDVALETIRSR